MPAFRFPLRSRIPLGSFASERRREALRTNLWFVPAVEVALAVLLFIATNWVDRAAYDGDIALPSWILSGNADAARLILATLAAAVITVVGVVFSIVMVTLVLASTQFGPRMVRNFVRDRGAQVTLGTFVASFVYGVLVLASIGPGPSGDFVPNVSITVTLVLVVADLGVLIYFIHHTAYSMQLPHVIAGIAKDLSRAIEAEIGARAPATAGPAIDQGPSLAEIDRRMCDAGSAVLAPTSGYLQSVSKNAFVGLAERNGAVLRLHHRPGHFVVRGEPLATVWPAQAAAEVERGMRRAHVVGASRTLTQDVAFAVDQLVEIAIRALSPAINDTFTAMTCIDWLGESLGRMTPDWSAVQAHRDQHGFVRVVTVHVSHERLVDRAFAQIRQAGRGLPAVMIRQLDALRLIASNAVAEEQLAALLRQAEMIARAADESVPEPLDRAAVRRAYDAMLRSVGQAPNSVDATNDILTAAEGR